MKNSFDLTSFRLYYYRLRENKFYPLFSITAIFLTGVILLVYVVIPQLTEWFSIQNEISETRKRISAIESNISFLSAVNSEQNTQDLAITTAALPFEKDVGGIFNAITTAAGSTGVSLGDFGLEVGTLASSSGSVSAPTTVTLELSVNGSIADVNRFIDLLYESVPIAELGVISSTPINSTVGMKFYYRDFPQVIIDNTVPLRSRSAAQIALLRKLEEWRPVALTTSPELEATDSAGIIGPPF